MSEAEMSQNEGSTSSERESLRDEVERHWKLMPFKGAFFALLAVWVGLFHFWGNSTMGYVNSHSLFVWLSWMWDRSPNDEHGFLIPFLVLGLFW